MSVASKSLKGLWLLVSEASVQTGSDIISSELEANLSLLSEGVLSVNRHWSKLSASIENISPYLNDFIVKLVELLGEPTMDKQASFDLFSAYLACDYRGTKKSLRDAVYDDRQQLLLLSDVWHFYRAERLYSLLTLKRILSHMNNEANRHSAIFADIISQLDSSTVANEEKNLRKSLLQQLRYVITEKPPSGLRKEMLSQWAHFNTREQCELLQLLLLYFHICGRPTEPADALKTFLYLLEIFQIHEFGHKESGNVRHDLQDSIGQLEVIVLIDIINLSSLSSQIDNTVSAHPLWRNPEHVVSIDKAVFNLGKLPEHGPVMLAWMLSHYIMDGCQEMNERYLDLGKRAIDLKCLSFLENCLKNEAVAGKNFIENISAGVCYLLLSALVNSFDLKCMGVLQECQCLALSLLKHEQIAVSFWGSYEQRSDGGDGLDGMFVEALTRFPFELRFLVQLCGSLASASRESASKVFSQLQHLPFFAEPINAFDTKQIKCQSLPQDKYKLLQSHRPYGQTSSIGHDNEIILAPGTIGICDQSVVVWDTSTSSYSVEQVFLCEIDLLLEQLSHGIKNVNPITLTNICHITDLICQLICLKRVNSTEKLFWQEYIERLYDLVARLINIPYPPLLLLESCIRCFTQVLKYNGSYVWLRLCSVTTGLFPFDIKSGSIIHMVNPGLIGSLLAQHECLDGQYPLTMSFLELLLTVVRNFVSEENIEKLSSCREHISPCLMFVIREVFPFFCHWRYSIASQREKLGQQILSICCEILKSPHEDDLQHMVADALFSTGPLDTLLALAGTGDKEIQSHIESQSSWECGTGHELSHLTTLALVTLNVLLSTPEAAIQSSCNRLTSILCSPPPTCSFSKTHFLLKVSHYLYYLLGFNLPVSAMNLLTKVADLFPLSLLACLGSDAEAVRDMLINRLNSRTDHVALKVAILKFFSACVRTQPGLVQLLIGAVCTKSLAVNVVAENDDSNVQLIDKSGCLGCVIKIMDEYNTSNANYYELFCAVVDFVYHLCQRRLVLALDHLKKQTNFWKVLIRELLNRCTADGLDQTLNAQILSIISDDIFNNTTHPTSPLISRLLSEKGTSFLVESNDAIISVYVYDKKTNNQNESLSVYTAWKTFLLVAAKSIGAINPEQNRQICTSLLKAIRRQIVSDEAALNVDVVPNLTELLLVLLRHWSSSENLLIDKDNVCLSLEEMYSNYSILHPKAKICLLSIATQILRLSDTKNGLWLYPAVKIMLLSITHNVGSVLIKEEKTIICLSVGLVRALISQQSNCDSLAAWLNVLHQNALIQTTLNAMHARLSWQVLHSSKDDILVSCLNFLIAVSEEGGACSLLNYDLPQLLWMPLSSIKPEEVCSEAWGCVFQLSLHLASTLLNAAQDQAVEASITLAALLEEHIASLLLRPRLVITEKTLQFSSTAVVFVSNLLRFQSQWLLSHPSSISNLYRCMTCLLHTCACLVLRPTLLSSLITGKAVNHEVNSLLDENSKKSRPEVIERRIRNPSATLTNLADYSVALIDSVSIGPYTMEDIVSTRCIMDILGTCLFSLYKLSPDLISLCAGHVVDIGDRQWPQLLELGFSSPNFEQDTRDTKLTYGTLITIANVCVRQIQIYSRSNAESVAPVSSSEASLRSRQLTVLELCIGVILSQALLVLSDPRSSGDRQFLRRELGAELGVLLEGVRRFSHRLNSKSPSSPGLTSACLSKTDEDFMKIVSNIVQNVFK